MAKRTKKAPAPQATKAPEPINATDVKKKAAHGVMARSTKRAAPPAPEMPAPARPARPEPIKVQAKVPSFYGQKRRRVGDVFVLRSPSHFSAKKHLRMNPGVPERVTTGNQEIERQKHELQGLRQGDQADVTKLGMVVGPDEADQVAEGDGNPIDD